jgi:hypothetical protein
MGLEKQTQEIGLKVRGFAPREQEYDRDEVYLPAISATMPAVCSQDWYASLLCDGGLQHS